jgi:flagellar biosynthesis protein FlhG
MHDQANQLRRLVTQSGVSSATSAAKGPKLVVLSGGKGGVGTTTIAVSLAFELARLGRQAVLVDADPEGGDAAVLCGVEERYTMADVLSERQSVEEALQPGPEGIRILPGAWGLDLSADCSPTAQERLVGQLQGLSPDAEIVLLDVGSGTSRLVRRFWQAAAEVLLVTTPDLTSVMDAYATAKIIARGDDSLRLRCVVNFAPDVRRAADVHARLAHACLRFLGIRLLSGKHIPRDPDLTQPGALSVPEVRELAETISSMKQEVQCRSGSPRPIPVAE